MLWITTHHMRDRADLERVVENISAMVGGVSWTITRRDGGASVTLSGDEPKVAAALRWLENE